MFSYNKYLQEQLKDPEFKAEYDALGPEYAVKRQRIRNRIKQRAEREAYSQPPASEPLEEEKQ